MTPTENNPIESANPMDPALEKAVSEIREEAPDAAAIEAAAARVWARLAAEADPSAVPLHRIRGCADFQALIPEYRAGRLSAARATLLKDHLHECVACRRIYEGKVVPMAAPARRTGHPIRWAAAAAVVAAAGLSIWIAVDQYGGHTGRAIVQTVNGTLYEVSDTGIRPLLAGQDLPDGVELRTAKDSDAMLQLRDGSTVELRERSGVSTTASASDVTVHLVRGSVLVQAAKRRTGHLFVATADCRVSVTGTIFSVSAGVKGSRVSVVQGEVHVAQDNQEKILHAGEQTVTNVSVDPVTVKDDISWSRDRERLAQQLDRLTSNLRQIRMPALRYSSNLLKRLPAGTSFYVSIPNLGEYLGEAQKVFNDQMAQSPDLRTALSGRMQSLEPLLEKMRAASEYLGEEIVIAGIENGDSRGGPAVLAEVKREGFAEFLKTVAAKLTIETRPGVVVFGPVPETVKALAAALDTPSPFASTLFYARIDEVYRDGAGILIAADVSQFHNQQVSASGARYVIANQRQVGSQLETTAAVAFDGPRKGIAEWLADPAPMGSLDYVSPDASLVAAFVVKNPGVIVDQVTGLVDQLPMMNTKARGDVHQQSSPEVRDDLAASLGGEFSISLDGAPFPVPSWKLVSEVYDPARMKATLQKLVAAHDEAAKVNGKPLRTGQEVVDGRTYYVIASNDPPNPLTEVHYTFADGYLIAGPTRALVAHALQMKTAGTSITHSAQFVAMTPRDRHMNFSALIYQHLGTSLAPLVSLFGALAPPGAGNSANGLQQLGNMKPNMIAAFGEPDRISISGTGDILGAGLTNMLGGNLMSTFGNALPFPQMQHNQFQGTRAR